MTTNLPGFFKFIHVFTVPSTQVEVTQGTLITPACPCPQHEIHILLIPLLVSSTAGLPVISMFLQLTLLISTLCLCTRFPPVLLVFLHLYPSFIALVHPAQPSSSSISSTRLPLILKPCQSFCPSVLLSPQHRICRAPGLCRNDLHVAVLPLTS